jgi:hypothetical protein
VREIITYMSVGTFPEERVESAMQDKWENSDWMTVLK